MKAIFSRMTPRTLLALVLITEILLGVTYIGVLLSQEVGTVFSLFLQYIYRLLHTVCLVLGLTLALRSADGRRIYYGLGTVGLLLGALVIKDYLSNFYAAAVTEGYYAGDALLIALPTTAMNTLLFTGLFLLAVYLLSYLFFFYMRPTDTPPRDIWSLDTSHTLAAICFLTCMIAVPDLIITFVQQIIFLVRDALWLPAPGEIVNMALDLILIPLFACLSYLTAYLAIKHIRDKQKAPEDPV